MGRPRLARYAARELARTPPSEGSDGAVPALRVEALPARQRRRFGKERLGVDGDQHGLVVVAAAQSNRNSRRLQAMQKRIHESFKDADAKISLESGAGLFNASAVGGVGTAREAQRRTE